MKQIDMRMALKNRYGPIIRGQHVDTMPDDQVTAIYHSLIERKDPQINQSPVPKKMRINPPMKWEQTKMEI